MYYMYYMYYMIDKRESKLHVQRVGVRGTNFALSKPGVWEAKRTCMQAGLQRPAEAAAPSQLKWPKSNSRYRLQYGNLTSGTRPRALYFYFTSTFSTLAAIPTAIPNLYLHPHFLGPIQMQPRLQITCAWPAAKEKRHSDPSSNARRVT
jgi:hypothetical protein